MAHRFTAYFWSKGLDPDSLCLPYLTALADAAGTLLIVGTLLLLKKINFVPRAKHPGGRFSTHSHRKLRLR
jgi:hypothetical protein